MLANEKYKNIVNKIDEAEKHKDINLLLDYLDSLGLSSVGEKNSMLANYELSEADGSKIKVHYHSYDPSGPFQNLPDINKTKIELFNGNNLVSEYSANFEDESIYG